jgi:thiamine-monophosphate kinase
VKFRIDGNAISVSEEFAQLAELAELAGADVWSWILQGGEDHALLATGRELPGVLIGEVVEGSGIIAELKGKEIKMAPVAWSHFL